MRKDTCAHCHTERDEPTYRFGPVARDHGLPPGWYHRRCLFAPVPDQFQGEPERHLHRDILSFVTGRSRVLSKVVPY